MRFQVKSFKVAALGSPLSNWLAVLAYAIREGFVFDWEKVEILQDGKTLLYTVTDHPEDLLDLKPITSPVDYFHQTFRLRNKPALHVIDRLAGVATRGGEPISLADLVREAMKGETRELPKAKFDAEGGFGF